MEARSLIASLGVIAPTRPAGRAAERAGAAGIQHAMDRQDARDTRRNREDTEAGKATSRTSPTELQGEPIKPTGTPETGQGFYRSPQGGGKEDIHP